MPECVAYKRVAAPRRLPSRYVVPQIRGLNRGPPKKNPKANFTRFIYPGTHTYLVGAIYLDFYLRVAWRNRNSKGEAQYLAEVDKKYAQRLKKWLKNK